MTIGRGPGCTPFDATIFARVGEDSLLKSFVFRALTVGLATAFVLEYRLHNPFEPYGEKDRREIFGEIGHAPTKTLALVRTSVVAFIACLLSLVLLFRLFGFGETMLACC